MQFRYSASHSKLELGGRSVLRADSFFHYFAEIIKTNFSFILSVCILHDFMDLLFADFLAFSVEDFNQAVLSDETCVVDIEVVEGKPEIVLSQDFLFFNSSC
jgi:hypothetical protein